MKNRFPKDLTLLVVGLSIIAISQIVSHYVTFPALLYGAFIGTGIGVLAISLLYNRRKPAY